MFSQQHYCILFSKGSDFLPCGIIFYSQLSQAGKRINMVDILVAGVSLAWKIVAAIAKDRKVEANIHTFAQALFILLKSTSPFPPTH